MPPSMFFEDRPELTAHLARIAGDLADDITFEIDIVAGAKKRNSHASSEALSRDNPR